MLPTNRETKSLDRALVRGMCYAALGFGVYMYFFHTQPAWPIQPHEVIAINTDIPTWEPPYIGIVFGCTRSSGAPSCPIGQNAAEVTADLLNQGYHVDPNLVKVSPITTTITFVK